MKFYDTGIISNASQALSRRAALDRFKPVQLLLQTLGVLLLITYGIQLGATTTRILGRKLFTAQSFSASDSRSWTELDCELDCDHLYVTDYTKPTLIDRVLLEGGSPLF